MKKAKLFDNLSLLVILASLVISALLYPRLPEIIASHWNFAGQVDGYSSKANLNIMLSVMLILMYALFQFLPHLDPKKDNYEKFGDAYKIIQFGILFLLSIIWIMTSLFNLGYSLPIGQIVAGLIGLLFILLGYYLPKLKTNWFIGIRTPWTISNDRVWESTHKLGKKVFIAAGLLLMIAPYFTPTISLLIFIVAMTLTMIPVIYSYVIFKKK